MWQNVGSVGYFAFSSSEGEISYLGFSDQNAWLIQAHSIFALASLAKN